MATEVKNLTKQNHVGSGSGGGEKSPKIPDVDPKAPAETLDYGERVRRDEAYLASKGWERMHVNRWGVSVWSDPAGKGPKNLAPIELRIPRRDGGVDKVQQACVPTAAWNYVLEDAVIVQKIRDAAGEETTQDRLTRIGRELDKVRQERAEIAQRLQALAVRPTPERPENVLNQLRQLKQELLESAARLRLPEQATPAKAG